MRLCKRIIARLDIKGSRLIKGVRFEGLRVLGDPSDAAYQYAIDGADELLYIDAVASLYGRCGLADLLRRTSRNIFIPVTAGGGIRCVADAAELLAAGADKIAVNTAAVHRPHLITDLAEAFGSQCVVVSIQARRTASGTWEAMTESGRECSGVDVLSWIQQVQTMGAGEILLTSVDYDGTLSGPDYNLIQAAAKLVKIPLVAAGGFADSKQIDDGLSIAEVSAVAVGSGLHYKRITINDVKSALNTQTRVNYGLRMRPNSEQLNRHPLLDLDVGVIDYGMGNQQSLINAFDRLGANVFLSDNIDLLSTSSLIALPGVGSFPKGMYELKERRLIPFIQRWALSAKPLMGICLGMQMLFESSDEYRPTAGLSLINGNVMLMEPTDEDGINSLPLPHIGWNQIIPTDHGSPSQARFQTSQYFVHSFSATNVPPDIITHSFLYGKHSYVAAVRSGSVAGFQFHPERSSDDGLAILATTALQLTK